MVRKIKVRTQSVDRSAALRYWQRQHTWRPAEPHWRTFEHAPAIGSNLNSTPVLIGKIKIDAIRPLSDADTDRPFGSIKLCTRLERRAPTQSLRRMLQFRSLGSSSAGAKFGNACCEWAKFLDGRLL